MNTSVEEKTVAENQPAVAVRVLDRQQSRASAPVFVLGCGRSGTKFLYYTLLSAGGFAVYHVETNVFNLLGLRFGNLAHRRNRRRLLDAYYTSKLFQQTGLQPSEIDERVMEDCRNTGDFLRIVMEAMARNQGVKRWAESTPLHLLYLPLLKKSIPEALIIHIIRDGRDVTASLNRIGWIRPFFWDRKRAFLAPAIFWQWVVSKGRRFGREMRGDYLEVHYEDLVRSPRDTLAKIGKFIEHDLDYDRIQRVALGSLNNPNTSFSGDGKETEANTIGRWQHMFTPAQVRDIESSIGGLLADTGYSLETSASDLHSSPAVRFMNFIYPKYFDLKVWLKSATPLGRFANTGSMGIFEADAAETTKS
jgi:hypothetical protein